MSPHKERWIAYMLGIIHKLDPKPIRPGLLSEILAERYDSAYSKGQEDAQKGGPSE